MRKIFLMTGFAIALISCTNTLFSQTFKQIKIGDQTWMAENLNVDKFSNGDLIPEVKSKKEWENAGINEQPAWCYYENDSENGTTYGKLYNWYAVSDSRGLAPSGWHIPSNKEWTQLTDYLGGEDKAGTKMKSESGWMHKGKGTNKSGYLGLPGGWRNYGNFDGIGEYGYWWSSTENTSCCAWISFLQYSNGSVNGSGNYNKDKGLSVRALRD
ncbi:fibrobacter succinogenes major paralogous domain-containing protein [Gillisia sp. CAL575]|uniref:fibrobacter succinogenes major paralogous domain-containing protein n=1 Tax=Gillisia sp. CAL575 TaxID=985255 RepID=UPI0003AA07EA|nr:fibrobacter succinogenes major paralogous domain-containing protein [Gillisia sp. CAL575]